MKPLPSQRLPALVGCGPVTGPGGAVVTMTESGWRYWARLEAARKSKRNRFVWHGIVAWIEERGCWRISFAAQEEKVV